MTTTFYLFSSTILLSILFPNFDLDIITLIFDEHDVRRSVHRSTIHKEKSKIFPHLYEAQHVSGDPPHIIKSLKLHWQPLVFHTWKVVGHVVGGRCQAQYAVWMLSSNYTANNPSCMQNQRLLVQF
jgi:hypothetical protein